MEVIFTPKALSDLSDWEKSGNIIIQKKIEQLLQVIRVTPFAGIGKPEPLRHGYQVSSRGGLITNTG